MGVPIVAEMGVVTMHLMEQRGYAVRLDWPAPAGAEHHACDPDSGPVHDFTQFTTSLARALRRAASTQRFWALGPLRPLAVTVVPITRTAYRTHARDCPSRHCPTTATLLGLSPDPGRSLLL